MSSLKVGDQAPEIDAQTSAGSRFVLSRQEGLCTVIFFYPKAFTPICTMETAFFRDNYNELALAGANLIGVSTDAEDTQCKFARDSHLNFPLIADADKRIAKAYDVLWPVLGVAQRYTFVVSPEMRLEAIFHHELSAEKHRDDVLRFVHAKFEAQRPKVG
ncbi:peroxiredoxin family protein [Polyangium spumosum]|uniref:thioredoxin-dependent peroxiredoxin n=1 Tax=Polyangium spumosum TaxID=889282 RepID=A0A6N7Q3T1_9BACT|nr:redoxin domain-containing protein [Polyangium spumosum]MRG97285.1 redoxin domain-containing protein [Polyangium spumosum]